MKRHHKDLVQYSTATMSIISGITLAFLSFFLNQRNIEDSILWYIAQTFVYAGSIFGVSAYVNTKVGEIRAMLTDNGIVNNITENELSDDDQPSAKKQKNRV